MTAENLSCLTLDSKLANLTLLQLQGDVRELQSDHAMAQ